MKVLNPPKYGGFITPKNEGNVGSHGNAGFAVVSNVSELKYLAGAKDAKEFVGGGAGLKCTFSAACRQPPRWEDSEWCSHHGKIIVTYSMEVVHDGEIFLNACWDQSLKPKNG